MRLEHCVGIEMLALNILKVAVGANLEFRGGILVAHDDSLAVHLQGAQGAHVRNAAFHSLLQGASLLVAVNDNHHAAGSHNSANAYGKGSFGHIVNVIVKESAVCDDSVLSESLHASE